MIDTHAHILPGIDDGPRDWDAALAMLAQAADDGTTVIVATPHYVEGRWTPSAATVRALVDEARQRAAEAGIRIDLRAGHEIHATVGIPRFLEEGRVTTLGDAGRHILIEFPYTEFPRWWSNLDAELRGAGLRPVLAHAERNAGIIADPARLHPLLERGWLAQIDVNSLLGRWGPRVLGTAERLLRLGWVHLAGSDAHNQVGRATGLSAARARITEIAGAEAAGRILEAWPAAILAGGEVDVPPPSSPPRGGFFTRIFGRR